jgi:hypothetical protein
MRRAIPIPHLALRIGDPMTLLDLIDAAEDAYERLITERVDYAGKVLTRRATQGAS